MHVKDSLLPMGKVWSWDFQGIQYIPRDFFRPLFIISFSGAHHVGSMGRTGGKL